MASTDLIVKADLKTYLRISATTEDALLEQLIDRASSAIEQYCKREFKMQQQTEYLDGDDGAIIYIQNAPICNSAGALLQAAASASITVWVDPDREYADGDKVDSDDLVLWPESGKIEYYGGIFTEGPKTVKVTYYGGYSTIPHDLQQACALLCEDWWLRRGYQNLNEMGGAPPLDFGEAVGEALLPRKVRTLLAPFVRYTI